MFFLLLYATSAVIISHIGFTNNLSDLLPLRNCIEIVFLGRSERGKRIAMQCKTNKYFGININMMSNTSGLEMFAQINKDNT